VDCGSDGEVGVNGADSISLHEASRSKSSRATGLMRFGRRRPYHGMSQLIVASPAGVGAALTTIPIVGRLEMVLETMVSLTGRQHRTK
jgi:hypothetical protein